MMPTVLKEGKPEGAAVLAEAAGGRGDAGAGRGL